MTEDEFEVVEVKATARSITIDYDEHIAGKHIEDNLESPIALCYNCKHPLAYGVHIMREGHHINQGFIERGRVCQIKRCECVMVQPRYVWGKFGEAIIQ